MQKSLFYDNPVSFGGCGFQQGSIGMGYLGQQDFPSHNDYQPPFCLAPDSLANDSASHKGEHSIKAIDFHLSDVSEQAQQSQSPNSDSPLPKSASTQSCISNKPTGSLASSDVTSPDKKCKVPNNVPKQIFPWMKETRQSSKQKKKAPPPAEDAPSMDSSFLSSASKRARTAYTNSQLVELEKEFHFNRYLCRPRRLEMAKLLNLSERQIKIWFQNRRMKFKKDHKGKGGGGSPGSLSPSSSPSLLPYSSSDLPFDGDCAYEVPMATTGSYNKNPGNMYGLTAYSAPLFESPSTQKRYGLQALALEYEPHSMQGDNNYDTSGYLGNYMENGSESCSMFSLTQPSSESMDYTCAAQTPSKLHLGPCDPHPTYTDLHIHNVPQACSHEPPVLTHL